MGFNGKESRQEQRKNPRHGSCGRDRFGGRHAFPGRSRAIGHGREETGRPTEWNRCTSARVIDDGRLLIAMRRRPSTERVGHPRPSGAVRLTGGQSQRKRGLGGRLLLRRFHLSASRDRGGRSRERMARRTMMNVERVLRAACKGIHWGPWSEVGRGGRNRLTGQRTRPIHTQRGRGAGKLLGTTQR